jgi:2-succinyl-6-hydroxy-2,4-cyclohexadiene-1-carboxylate synthase
VDRLAFEEHGSGPTLALLHGFTQTARSWRPLHRRLAEGRRLMALDAPGHGRSAPLRLDLWATGHAITRTSGPADLLGYSMGGRMALHAALADSAAVRRLVLIGATAGIADPRARAQRRADDAALADRIEAGGDEGLPAFLREWLSSPLFAGLSAEAADVASRLDNTAAGLASSLRLCGTGGQDPLDQRLGEITAPTLLVVGERDTKFQAEAERLRAGLPAAEIAVVAGAGHACHLEQPAAFLAVVEAWLTG